MSLWEGHLKNLSEKIMRFNASFDIDKRMYKEDIECSIAHVKMLSQQKIIDNAREIIDGLNNILSDIKSGKLKLDGQYEDIHTFVEEILTERIGDAGKKIHTARSRNDQVAVDLKVYVKKQITEIQSFICDLISVIADKAEKNIKVIMPSYTHLQRAQPSTFANHILAYAFMFRRDFMRLKNCLVNMDECPLGACACSGTTYLTDRFYIAKQLNFVQPTENSIDSVSDRDFAIELISCCAIIMMHLSRFSEELILWSSWEFGFISIADEYCTGSSIMPQKKNPDMLELIRGKTGKVYGNLIAILTMMKGLPLAYNKDMQESTCEIFEVTDTVKDCLSIFAEIIKTIKINSDNMQQALKKGFLNATDCADYLTKKGMPFREAYKIVGSMINLCIANKKTLEDLDLEDYKKFSGLFDNDIFDEINLKNCVEKRMSFGGPSQSSVKQQIKSLYNFLAKIKI